PRHLPAIAPSPDPTMIATWGASHTRSHTTDTARSICCFKLATVSPCQLRLLSLLGRLGLLSLPAGRLSRLRRLSRPTRRYFVIMGSTLVPGPSHGMARASATVAPTSANVERTPRSTPPRTAGPPNSTGTYSRA